MNYLRWTAVMLAVLVLFAGCGDDEIVGQIGSPADDMAYGAASGGSVYAVGFTEGSLDGLPREGYADIAIVKFDSSRRKLWARQQGTSRTDIAYAAASDSAGNIYAAGTTYGDLDGNVNEGFFDVFLVKYDSNGLKKWTQQIGTYHSEAAYGAATDSEGNIYVAGYTDGDLPGFVTEGGSDCFLAKFDESGALRWIKQWGTSYHEYAMGVATDSVGNVFVTGFTWGGIDGNLSSGASDVFVKKFNSSGATLWSRQFGSPSIDEAYSAATDSLGNLYISGATEGAIDGIQNAGKADAFITKYDPDGNRLWTKTLATAADDVARGISVDQMDRIYVTGYTFGGLHGNKNEGKADVFLSRYESDGTFGWTRQAGTYWDDFAYSLAVDSEGYIFPVGTTWGDLGGETTKGLFDIFVLKYDSAGLKH